MIAVNVAMMDHVSTVFVQMVAMVALVIAIVIAQVATVMLDCANLVWTHLRHAQMIQIVALKYVPLVFVHVVVAMDVLAQLIVHAQVEIVIWVFVLHVLYLPLLAEIHGLQMNTKVGKMQTLVLYHHIVKMSVNVAIVLLLMEVNIAQVKNLSAAKIACASLILLQFKLI